MKKTNFPKIWENKGKILIIIHQNEKNLYINHN